MAIAAGTLAKGIGGICIYLIFLCCLASCGGKAGKAQEATGDWGTFVLDEAFNLDVAIDAKLKFFHSRFGEHLLSGNVSAENALDHPVCLAVHVALFGADKELIAVGSLLRGETMPLEPKRGQHDVMTMNFGIGNEQSGLIRYYLVRAYEWEPGQSP